MSFLMNILWIVTGGAAGALLWYMYGILWCLTIVGIPLGKQCFKFGSLTLMPFGKKIVEERNAGAISALANVIWAVTTGIVMAAENAVMGLLLCCTIIGIPFGKQYFKLARLSLAPFGFEVRK